MCNLFGWESPDRLVIERYIKKCALFSKSDVAFSNFRQDYYYTRVLEGNPIIGEIHLKYILDKYGIDSILDNLEEFKENDIYGHPTIMEFPEIGKICPYTILYISNALDIKKMMGDFSPKRIVEIGGGFGSLCKTLSVYYDFDEYILIDFPEVLGLCEKYLDHFPKIKDKITYLPCDKAQSNPEIGDIDLFIAIASLAECNIDTQMAYVNIMLKSIYGFITYNVAKQNMEKISEKATPIFDIKTNHHIDASELMQFSKKEKSI